MDDNNSDYEVLKRWRKNIPDLHNGAYRRTWDKAVSKQSMRAAVDAKCQDCQCWQQAEVKRCDIITCPLWQYRPLQEKDGEREKAVRGHLQEIQRLEGTLADGKGTSFPRSPIEATLGARNDTVCDGINKL